MFLMSMEIIGTADDFMTVVRRAMQYIANTEK